MTDVPSPPSPAPSVVLAVVSGKGGAGKSVLAVNLAEALAARGVSVALLDADAGQGACRLLLNEPPAETIHRAARTTRLDPVFQTTEAGVTLVEASDEPLPEGGLDAVFTAGLDRTLAELRTRHQVVLIDAPAGTDGLVRWALDRADEALLVLVGEPTAVADAYRLAKLLWGADASYPVSVVVNAAETAEEAQSVAERFAAITERFIGPRAAYLGWIPFSVEMRRSVMAQTPAVRTPGALAEAFETLARALQAR